MELGQHLVSSSRPTSVASLRSRTEVRSRMGSRDTGLSHRPTNSSKLRPHTATRHGTVDSSSTLGSEPQLPLLVLVRNCGDGFRSVLWGGGGIFVC